MKVDSAQDCLFQDSGHDLNSASIGHWTIILHLKYQTCLVFISMLYACKSNNFLIKYLIDMFQNAAYVKHFWGSTKLLSMEDWLYRFNDIKFNNLKDEASLKRFNPSCTL